MKREPKTWSDVWTYHVKNGKPYKEAAFRADQWEKRQKAAAEADRNFKYPFQLEGEEKCGSHD